MPKWACGGLTFRTPGSVTSSASRHAPRLCESMLMPGASASPFTSIERDLIRREFCKHFGSYPKLADGMLRTWPSGPKADLPKVPKAMAGLVERGLVDIPSRPQPAFVARAHFTAAGLAAMRELLQDRRSMNPQQFAHLHQELGIDPAGEPAEQELG